MTAGDFSRIRVSDSPVAARTCACAPDARLEFAFSHYKALGKVRAYVMENLDKPLHVSEIAGSIGLSPSRLSHLFAETTGISLTHWIRYERVRRATAIIEKSNTPMAEIAYAVGFQTTRTFQRTFRNVTGMTATQYRAAIRAQKLSQI